MTDTYIVLQEVLLLALRLPAAKKKVDRELEKAKLHLEKSMVPQGPSVKRHLTLPQQGQSPEWIMEEMAKMDAESEGHSDWQAGRISGAVYRAYHVFFAANSMHIDESWANYRYVSRRR